MKRFNGVITAAALLGGALVAEAPLFATAASADTDPHCTQSTENRYSLSPALIVTCTYDEAGDYQVAVPADADSTTIDATGGRGGAPASAPSNQTPATRIFADYGTTKNRSSANPFVGKTLDITVGGNADGRTGGFNGGADGGFGAGGGGGRTDITSGGAPLFVVPGAGGAGAESDGTSGVGGYSGTEATAGAYASGESTDGNGGTAGHRGSNGVGGVGGSPQGQSGTAKAGGAGGEGCNGGGGGGAGYGGGGGGGAGAASDVGNCGGGGGGASGESLQPADNLDSFESSGSAGDPNLVISWTIPIAIDAADVPAGTVGQDYSYKFTTNMPDATFEVAQGTLPDGLTLAADGTLSGKPTTASASNQFEIQASDANGTFAYQYVDVPVNAATTPVAFTNGAAPDATVGQPYTFDFTASDCPGCSFDKTAGELPDGLTLAADGTLSGTPTSEAKDYSFTVTATASNGQTAALPVTLKLGKATPTVTVVYTPRNLAAKVVGPTGAPVPTGSVRFEVDGKSLGSLPLKNGAVTKPWLIPGGAHTYRVYYNGDTRYVPTPSALRDRKDPTITLFLGRDSNPAGWFRSPVTIYSSCTITTAPLATPCPAPFELTAESKNRTITRTISAVDGGAARATLTGLNLDRTLPTAALHGVSSTATYTAQTLPNATCTASDALSGLDGNCVVTYAIDGNKITYKGVATDVAGNVRTVTITAKYKGAAPSA